MTIWQTVNGMQKELACAEGCIFSKQNEELLQALNDCLKSTGFSIVGGSVEKRALYIDAESMKCRSAIMMPQHIAAHIRQRMSIWKLVVDGQVC